MWALNQYSCPNQVTECEYDGYSGKHYGNSPCYMSDDYQQYTNWYSKSCPSSWKLPTQGEFASLMGASQAGNGACLYEQGWKLNGTKESDGSIANVGHGYYLSATAGDPGKGGYAIVITSSSASMGYNFGSGSSLISVRCLHY